jgi:hypothetical protein
MPGGWGAAAVRFIVGLVGGVINAVAALSTIVGAIGYAIRQQGNGSQYSALIHVGNFAFNALALCFLLVALGDEGRSAWLTFVTWAVGTATVFYVYWSWVLG